MRLNPFVCYQDHEEGKWKCIKYLRDKGFDEAYYKIVYVPYSLIHIYKVPEQGWYIKNLIRNDFVKWRQDIREKING